MAKHEQKQCPRCGTLFECKTGSIERCQCQTVSLDDDQLDYIRSLYDDCLCAECLEALRMECNLRDYDRRMHALLCR